MTDLLTAITTQTFSSLFSTLFVDYTKRKTNKGKKDERFKSNLRPHLENTFIRFKSIKTILQPLTPTDFLSIHATQRFKFHDNNNDDHDIDHYTLVESIINNPHNLIITGTAGSGKSIFMRYLWLSLFLNGDGRIPVFIELRNINSLPKPDLLQLLYNTVVQGKAKITRADFVKMVENGDFLLLLDGFDELNHSNRDAIQSQVMELAENYLDLSIVMTTRPSDGFQSWSSFDVLKILDLNKSDVLELIERASYNDEFKALFYSEVENGLYEKHQSFLSNPLLACLMLLTFSQEMNIPDEMHSFYSQAFNALYHKHDRFKPGVFHREFHTNISEDKFKRLFAFFCLTTYYSELFEFSESQILEHVKNSIELSNVDVDARHYLSDLIESVCIIVNDDGTFTFTHRSFQEYFAALCMGYISNEQFEKLLEHLIERANDQFLPLLYKMQPDRFSSLYIIKIGSKYIEGLLRRKTKRQLVRHMDESRRLCTITASRNSPENNSQTYDIKNTRVKFDQAGYRVRTSGELGKLMNVCGRLSLLEFKRTDLKRHKYTIENFQRIENLFGYVSKRTQTNDLVWLEFSASNGKLICSYKSYQDEKHSQMKTIKEDRELLERFFESTFHDIIVSDIDNTKEFITNQSNELQTSKSAMKEIFNLG